MNEDMCVAEETKSIKIMNQIKGLLERISMSGNFTQDKMNSLLGNTPREVTDSNLKEQHVECFADDLMSTIRKCHSAMDKLDYEANRINELI